MLTSSANIQANKHHTRQYPSSGAFCTPAVQPSWVQDDEDDEDDIAVWIRTDAGEADNL